MKKDDNQKRDIFIEIFNKLTKPYCDKIEELKAKISRLEHDLEMSPIQFDSEKELKAYMKFCKKHEKCQLTSKANGGKVPYIILNGTGIGTCKKVVCQVCGKEQEITDINVW